MRFDYEPGLWGLSVFVRDNFWLGSLLGGFIFGIRTSLAGGRASGALWRAGEGHVKRRVAVTCFALSTWYFREWLAESRRRDCLGEAVFLPDYIAWEMAAGAVLVLMAMADFVAVDLACFAFCAHGFEAGADDHGCVLLTPAVAFVPAMTRRQRRHLPIHEEADMLNRNGRSLYGCTKPVQLQGACRI